ncbi:peptidylprolyl isomerase [Bacillus sp. CLL-7-23]|uniref:Foldase protein PrsA n=1 Tax=Bacillus changyiensis TaxID=3004103 RepID=A0ABT4X7Z6_9BACI|nr:peptidylprolyl isomerase [Bacillus changyiensis]MDA7028412.1 peptidylprolyl isomerase [Bacillus changyiensis]
MKKMVIAAVTATSILTLSACKGGDSEVVAETKYGNITKDDLYNELRDANGADGVSFAIKKKILKDKYSVSDKDVDKRYDEHIKEPNYKNLVEIYGEDKVKEQVKIELLVEKAKKDAMKVEDKEVKKYYDSLKGKIRASHILVKDKKTIEEVQKKLKNGKKFEDLAKEYGQDQTAQVGGDLGWFEKGKMEKPFEKAAFALKKGKVSEPVKTSHGYHLILKTDEYGKYDDMKKDLKKELIETKQSNPNGAVGEYLNKLEEEGDVKIKDKVIKKLIEQQKKAIEEQQKMQNPQG